MSRRKRSIWFGVGVVLVIAIAFDLVMTHQNRGYITLTPVGASGGAQSMVTMATSQDLSPAVALDDSTLTYAQVKELVYLALDRDLSSRSLRYVIDYGDWVAIKVNMVAAPLIISGTKTTSFWNGLVDGLPYWGCVSDLRVTKALIEYLIEYVQPRRISIVEASGELIKTGSPYYASYDVDGWTVTWDEFDGLSYAGMAADFNAAQSGTVVDIVDMNDDDPVLVAVPGGGLQLLGGQKRDWGYEDFEPGYGTPRGSWYVPRVLTEVDKLIDQPTLKTTAPGITVFLKNYVGCVSMRGYGGGPGKGSVIDAVAIMAGYMDLVRIRPPDYCLAAGFWSSYGWYGNSVNVNHNVVIAGNNVVASEAVAARVMGWNPRDLVQLHLAQDVGLGSFEEDDYQVMGGDPSQLVHRYTQHAAFKPLGFQQFVMLGPFAESNINVDLLGSEASATGVPGQSAGGQTWWSYAHRPGYPEPYTDFTHLALGSLNGKTLYAYAEVVSNGAQDGYFRFGCDGPARVWVNGTQVLDTGGAVAYAHQAPVVHLNDGSNDVLVKIVGTASGGGFAINITDSERMLTDIRTMAPPDPALAAPTAIGFTGGATDGPRPRLNWTDVAGASTYALEWSGNWTFSGATAVAGLTSSEYWFPSALADGTYYWRVKAVAGSAESAWSAVDSFSIIPVFGIAVSVLLAGGMMAFVWWRYRG